MNRGIALLAAAGLSLGLALPAQAQLVLNWIDTPPAGDALTKRLEDEAAHMAKYDFADHLHTVAFEYIYPNARDEYEALDGAGLILVSAVAKDPKELPIKQVVLRFGLRDVVLEPIASRQSTISPTSTLAKDIGVNREDAFFLLPSELRSKMATLVIVFALPGRQFEAGRLSPGLPDTPKGLAKSAKGPPDAATFAAVLAREYPNLVKP